MQVIRGSISNNNMNYYCNWMNIIAEPRINGYMYYILRSCNGNNETPQNAGFCFANTNGVNCEIVQVYSGSVSYVGTFTINGYYHGSQFFMNNTQCFEALVRLKV